MAQVPARCRDCRATFPSGIVFHNSGNINISNSVISCPRCGGVADILSGSFTAEDVKGPDGVIREKIYINGQSEIHFDNLETGPNRKLIVEALNRALIAARDENDYQKAIHEINRVYPPLAISLKKKTKTSGLLLLIPLLLSLLHGCSVSTNINVNINLLFAQVLSAIENTPVDGGQQIHIENQTDSEQGKSGTAKPDTIEARPTKTQTEPSEQHGVRRSGYPPKGKRAARRKK